MAKKVKKVESTLLVESPKTTWQKIKDWFYNSETVLLSWITGLSGTVMGIVGSLDLSPFWSLFQTGTAFTSKQLTWMGVGVIGAAVTMYIARVRNTKAVAGHLLPTKAE